MAEVVIHVGGRAHRVACRDGEEGALAALGRRLDSYAPAAARAAGGQGGERTLLYVALMLADELTTAERAPGGSVTPVVLERIAVRLESLAAHLEVEATSA